MLKSELDRLEKAIGDIINNDGIAKPVPPDRLTAQVNSVTSLCAGLRDKWSHELFSSAKDQVVTRYVRYHQAGITQLSNAISRQFSKINPVQGLSVDFRNTYERLLYELEQLLLFLKHQCYRYFDWDYKISIYSCQRYCGKISVFRRELETAKGHPIDPALITVVGVSINEQLREVLASGISYRQTGHILTLLRTVHQFIYVAGGSSTDPLVTALYRQNFNSLHFLSWYQKRTLQEISQIPNVQDQQRLIITQIDLFSRIFVDPLKAFEPELPSIATMLLSWLEEKVSTTDQYTVIRQPVNVRLPLTLSVPQFAMFVRIFFQAGCFPDTNVSKLTRFFSQHFTTKKQVNVSFKSFARAFYRLDQSAAAVVRDYLQKMINYLNKTYFP